MHRCLRLDVMDDNAVLVLVFDPGGDFAFNDALEDGLAHRKITYHGSH